MTDKWKFLKDLSRDFGKEDFDPHSTLALPLLSYELESAIVSPRREDLASARGAIGNALHGALWRVSDDVRKAMNIGGGGHPELVAAYFMGQLSFAEGLVGRAYTRRKESPIDDLASLWGSDPVKELAGRVADAGHRMTRSPAGEIVFALESGYYLLIVDNLHSGRRYQADRELPFAVIWASDAMVLADVDEPVALQGEFATAEEALAFACGRIDVEWKPDAAPAAP